MRVRLISPLTPPPLQAWLRAKGLKVTGKKEELIDRVNLKLNILS